MTFLFLLSNAKGHHNSKEMSCHQQHVTPMRHFFFLFLDVVVIVIEGHVCGFLSQNYWFLWVDLFGLVGHGTR